MEKFDNEAYKDAEERTKHVVERYGSDSMFFTLDKALPNTIRFLPPWDGSGGVPFHSAVTHWFKIDDRNRPFLCCKEKYGECPMCDRHEELVGMGHNPYGAEVSKAQPKFLYNILLPNGSQKIFPMKIDMHLAAFKKFGEALGGEVMRDKKGQGVSWDVTSPIRGGIFTIKLTEARPGFKIDLLNPVNGTHTIDSSLMQRLRIRDLTKIYADNPPEELRSALAGVDINAKLKSSRGLKPKMNIKTTVKKGPIDQPKKDNVEAKPVVRSEPKPESKVEHPKAKMVSNVTPINANGMPDKEALLARLKEKRSQKQGR